MGGDPLPAIDLPRRHGRGAYASEDLRKRFPEEFPLLYGEEIDDEQHCCVWNLTAALRPPGPGETVQFAGRPCMTAFGRTIDFEIEMGAAADAQRVQVIQYWKDEIYQVGIGTPRWQSLHLAPKLQPAGNPGWHWKPGPDGWTVDSEDPDRCWPKAGFLRAGRKASCHDTVSTSLTTLQRALNAGAPHFQPGPNADFPHQLTTLYKTDIFCSEQDVCDEVVARNQVAPIASVAWRENFSWDAVQVGGKWWIVATPQQITIDQIAVSVYRWCDASPYRPQ